MNDFTDNKSVTKVRKFEKGAQGDVFLLSALCHEVYMTEEDLIKYLSFRKDPIHIIKMFPWVTEKTYSMEYASNSIHTVKASQEKNIIYQLFACIQELITLSLVHMDIKPDNIIISPNLSNERVVLIDFDIAQRISNSFLLSPTGSLHWHGPINSEFDILLRQESGQVLNQSAIDRLVKLNMITNYSEEVNGDEPKIISFKARASHLMDIESMFMVLACDDLKWMTRYKKKTFKYSDRDKLKRVAKLRQYFSNEQAHPASLLGQLYKQFQTLIIEKIYALNSKTKGLGMPQFNEIYINFLKTCSKILGVRTTFSRLQSLTYANKTCTDCSKKRISNTKKCNQIIKKVTNVREGLIVQAVLNLKQQSHVPIPYRAFPAENGFNVLFPKYVGKFYKTIVHNFDELITTLQENMKRSHWRKLSMDHLIAYYQDYRYLESGLEMFQTVIDDLIKNTRTVWPFALKADSLVNNLLFTADYHWKLPSYILEPEAVLSYHRTNTLDEISAIRSKLLFHHTKYNKKAMAIKLQMKQFYESQPEELSFDEWIYENIVY